MGRQGKATRTISQYDRGICLGQTHISHDALVGRGDHRLLPLLAIEVLAMPWTFSYHINCPSQRKESPSRFLS